MKLLAKRYVTKYVLQISTIILSSFFVLTQSAFAIPQSATGTISGIAASNWDFLTDGGFFSLDFTKDFPDGQAGRRGVKEHLYFVAGSAVNYSYNVPYSLSFDFPTEVTPGERVYLNPTVTWGLPGLQATGALSYMTEHYLWIDAPYDGWSYADITMRQYSDRLEVGGSIPYLPAADPASVSFTLDSSSPSPLDDFGDGEASFAGVTNKLGGVGSINSSGSDITAVGDNHITIGATGSFTDAWYTSGDQIAFLAKIPPILVVFLPLDLLGFDLNHIFDVDILRQDRTYLELTSLPYIDIPDNAPPGTPYIFDLNLPIDYKGQALSDFDYIFNTKVTFDGPFFDEVTFLDFPIGSLDAGQVYSEWFTGTSTFHLSGSVNVVPEPSTLLLLGSGLIGLAGLRKKFRG